MKIDLFAGLMTGFEILDKIESFVKKQAVSLKYKKIASTMGIILVVIVFIMGYLRVVGYSPLYFGKIECFVFIFWLLPQVVFATISVRSMMKYLFVDLLLIMGVLYLLMVMSSINVNYLLIGFLYSVLWIIISLISEIEVAKMTNNIIITVATIVITIISIVVSIQELSKNNDILPVLQGFMLVLLPFLCIALSSNLIVQAKEYWRKKYRVKKTRVLCKFISNNKSDQN